MKIEDWRDVLGDGLMVVLDLPVAPSERPVTANDTAAHLLEAIAVLEDGPQAYATDDPPSPELQRLVLKVDLLTDLVSSLLADRVPRETRVSVSGDGLVLHSGSVPPDCGRIELFPCQWLAQPVVLEVGAFACRGGQCGAKWRSPDPGLKDALGRWVFRMHRREVARQRMQSGDARTDLG